MHFKLSKKIFFVLLLLPIFWSLCTKNPAGTSIESNYETISSLEFLYDLTYQKQQKSVKEQSILSAELDIYFYIMMLIIKSNIIILIQRK